MIQVIGLHLNQWDVGRSVSVRNADATHVHFANQGDSKAVIIEIINGEAKIPDYLLQTGKPILAYAVHDGVTLGRKSCSVRKRERPEDYVYEDDERNYIYELITDAQNAIENANNAADEVRRAKENGEFDGKPGDPFTYDDFTEEQLAELKGEPGDPGYTPVRGKDYWTEADIAEIKGYVDEAILGGAW